MSHEHEHLPLGTAENPLGRAFVLGIGLNVSFVALEAVFGVTGGSDGERVGGAAFGVAGSRGDRGGPELCSDVRQP